MEAAEAGAEAVPFWFAVGTALEEVELPPVLLTRVFILRNRRGRGASLCVEDAGDCGLKNEAYQKINFQINYKKLFKLIANLKGINCHVKIEQSV